MTKYTATFEFGSDAERSEINEWFELLKTGFPNDVKATLKQEPMVLVVEEVTDQHAGNLVSFTSNKYGTVIGVLEHVYTVASGAGRVLVVGGNAYHLTYEVVTLSEW